MKLMTLRAALFGATLLAAPVYAQEVEVLHWWTSPGEAAAVNVAKEMLNAQGIGWKDAPIAGGGGDAAMTALRARVVAGDAPTGAMVLGYDIKDWAELDLLGDISSVAEEGNWDTNYPEPLKFFGKYDDKWVATPFDIHSTNWLWINKAVFDSLGVKEPTNWDEFIAMLDAAKAKGVIPLAHGGQGWQDDMILQNVMIATGGIDFYSKAILEHDKEALGSDTMRKVLERVLQLKTYMDPNFPNRDWNLATAMVINGQALTQTMGDWAKGEFIAADKKANVDYMCLRFPGTEGDVLFVANSLVFFKVSDDKKPAQEAFAKLLMQHDFQEKWAAFKGSVPAALDASDANLDDCGKKAYSDYKAAAANGTLLGSEGGFAAPAAMRRAIQDAVAQLLTGDLDIDGALKALVASTDAG